MKHRGYTIERHGQTYTVVWENIIQTENLPTVQVAKGWIDEQLLLLSDPCRNP